MGNLGGAGPASLQANVLPLCSQASLLIFSHRQKDIPFFFSAVTRAWAEIPAEIRGAVNHPPAPQKSPTPMRCSAALRPGTVGAVRPAKPAVEAGLSSAAQPALFSLHPALYFF